MVNVYWNVYNFRCFLPCCGVSNFLSIMYDRRNTFCTGLVELWSKNICSGNALTIFIMEGLGMAVGGLLWNTVTCIMGWAVSRFGLFGR